MFHGFRVPSIRSTNFRSDGRGSSNRPGKAYHLRHRAGWQVGLVIATPHVTVCQRPRICDHESAGDPQGITDRFSRSANTAPHGRGHLPRRCHRPRHDVLGLQQRPDHLLFVVGRRPQQTPAAGPSSTPMACRLRLPRLQALLHGPVYAIGPDYVRSAIRDTRSGTGSSG